VTFFSTDKNFYVNIWFDWNRDGDWDDDLPLPGGGTTPEWAVQDQDTGLLTTPDVYQFTTPAFTPWHPDGFNPSPVWMRITLSEQQWQGSDAGGSGPPNGYDYGETEDYYIEFPPPVYDYGDAPVSYSTLDAHHGAKHLIHQDYNIYLGNLVDIDADGQPVPPALGDDNDGTDDEDGVDFTSLIMPGVSAAVDVTASTDGFLDAWIDFNNDGDWDDPCEMIFNSQNLTSGLNPLTFDVPFQYFLDFGIADIDTFARFRFSTMGGLSFDGPASNGEVEDYQVYIAWPLDFGDAHYTYPVELPAGAYHYIDPLFYLGELIDPELDGKPHHHAKGDDLADLDDEDGVVFTSPLLIGQTATVDVVVSQDGFLDGWIDFYGNDDWLDLDDQIFISEPLTAGVNHLSFTIPFGLSARDTFARFRLSSAGGLLPDGAALDGEVEDYHVLVELPPLWDLGDAPDSSNNHNTTMTTYPTSIIADFPTVYGPGAPDYNPGLPPYGPIHWLPRDVFLGDRVSLENEADSGPDQDDPNNNIIPLQNRPDLDNADDGVLHLPLNLTHCALAEITYKVTVDDPVQELYINVWLDWNRDGDWNDDLPCPTGGTAPEWAVANHVLGHLTKENSPYIFTTPSFTAWHPDEFNPAPIWMRITLSEIPFVSSGSGGSGPPDGYAVG
ncbi:MAG: hypothetical protein GY869_12785, partial [Planctomycetes bacterium]|nr:hypothetical protein [Planctomycetota bacterium]